MISVLNNWDSNRTLVRCSFLSDSLFNEQNFDLVVHWHFSDCNDGKY